MSRLPFYLPSTGEPMITVSWVESELAPLLGMLISGRPDHARQQLNATLSTLRAITEALTASTDASGDDESCQAPPV
ncbi:hypothetical protein UFOVP1008_5 [uncultured Caudovirales phage]|uniref:Uncharacterized protein n=1 Tax=uncultured Caudovirales phage TaxID=2100421 RepID=A0A6J5QCW8_9CAUD|nr:hypothetical protein UFOVP498_13 [uncultured Caudovirales phage]CAB4177524.1 hypothetical protein UFOVP1008_5 [uncultured Caudovirales phage]CAB4187436.1 hypothetical protein UFOVP1160_41 [uncultured Caudovirales phage]CAB4199702.1 hypothetical protein UFOVP1352_9 [uncultured Caudovirales phage]